MPDYIEGVKKMINIQSLSLRHPPDARLFSQASMSVEAGESVALMGPSGTGKTTLGLVIVGLKPPHLEMEGQLEVFGSCWQTLTEAEKRHRRGHFISMIFQDPNLSLNPYFRIQFHFEEVLKLSRQRSRQEIKECLITSLNEVQLFDHQRILYSYPHELSGGEKQRVIIALALINQPKLLVADEPTASLDFVVKVEILKLLKEIQRRRNLSLFLITHQAKVAHKMCDKIYRIEDKKIAVIT